MTTAIVATPYGRDTSATDRIRPGRIVTGGVLLGEALYRRYTTQRGTLLDDLNYGLPIAQWLNAAFTPDLLASIPGQIRNEGLKDRRIDSIDVTVAKVNAREIDITIEGFGAQGETFALVLHVDDVTVALLSLEGSDA